MGIKNEVQCRAIVRRICTFNYIAWFYSTPLLQFVRSSALALFSDLTCIFVDVCVFPVYKLAVFRLACQACALDPALPLTFDPARPLPVGT